MSEVRHPLALWVDLFVFAPIGVAVVVKEHLPELVGEGRQRVETRVRMARIVGEFAVTMGRREVEKRLASFGTAADDLIDPEPGEGHVDLLVDEESDRWDQFVTGGPDHSPAPAAVPSADELAIPGYESLAASQVVDRLPALSLAELGVVRRYEAAGRHRRTILHRIDQLTG